MLNDELAEVLLIIQPSSFLISPDGFQQFTNRIRQNGAGADARRGGG